MARLCSQLWILISGLLTIRETMHEIDGTESTNNCVSFPSIDLCQEEGGCSVELIPNGRDVDVTAANVYDYVRKYSECRMFKCQRKALEVGLVRGFLSWWKIDD